MGVELAGAMKNVMAIAAGACQGLGFGRKFSGRADHRGLAEMTRLIVALGGKPETLSGLAGLGDLVLTCHGALSRNRHVGYELGRGRSLARGIGRDEDGGGGGGNGGGVTGVGAGTQYRIADYRSRCTASCIWEIHREMRFGQSWSAP